MLSYSSSSGEGTPPHKLVKQKVEQVFSS